MFFHRAATWEAGAFADGGGRNEERAQGQFRTKVKRVAARLPFAEDLLAAYYCAFDRATPLQVKAALMGALAYFVLPFDFIPDFLPLIGFTDDAAILITAIRMVGAHMRPEHRLAARAALDRLNQYP